MNPLIIGLLGKAGTGKSTAAKYLKEHYGATIFSLAMPLKHIAHDVFEFTVEQLWGSQEQKEAIDPRYGFSPRWLLQKLGTEGIRRHLGQDVWVNATLRAIEEAAPRIAVIEDVRFINEAKAIAHMHSGHVVKLICSDAPPATNAVHPSEAEVDLVPERMISTVITSHRTPDSVDLKEKIAAFVERSLYMAPAPAAVQL